MSIKVAALVITSILVPASVVLNNHRNPENSSARSAALAEVDHTTRILAQQISVLGEALEKGQSSEKAEEVLYVRGQLAALSDRLEELTEDLDRAPHPNTTSGQQEFTLAELHARASCDPRTSTAVEGKKCQEHIEGYDK